jgi:predicted RNase H-like HicB family nuclease
MLVGHPTSRHPVAVAVSARLSLTAVYEEVEGGWVQARIAELPPVITVAATREEAADLLMDALREYLLSLTDPEAPPAAGDPVEIVLGA